MRISDWSSDVCSSDLVIKTALSLQQRCIPASLHFNEPNPSIDFAASPFVVNAAMTAWPDGDAPRRAGVSALGVGGTNAHVVMEQAPARANSEPARGPQLLTLSARTPAALVQAASRPGAPLPPAPAPPTRSDKRSDGEKAG